jgi:acetoacetate decarboxylase
MAKTGKFNPSSWGRFMPVHNPISQKGPWLYRDTECLMVEFETSVEDVLAILPSDLEIYEPASAFMVIETNHWTTLGPYSEVYVGLMCTWKGDLYAYVPGVYVTGENSQILGREIWGFGKKRAHRIELIKHDNNSVEAVMEIIPGDTALRAIMKPQINDTISGLPLICLRVVPDAEGKNIPALAQLVSVSFTADPLKGDDGKEEVFSGPGEMRFQGLSDVNFPVKKVLKCTYCHFNADLPYGKILKTYTNEELKDCN